MHNINITNLLKKLEKEKINIIDIRNNYDYLLGKIPTAINVPKNILLIKPENYLNKKEIYYIYCNSGITSQEVVNRLNSMGYNTVNINGGFNNYLLSK